MVYNQTNVTMTTTASKKPQIKRYREPLSPKSILDRPTLLKDLKTNGIFLKNTEQTLDLFYQLLHRKGYPPFDEFVAELCSSDKKSSPPLLNDVDDVDQSSSTRSTNNNLTATKNPVSKSRNRLPQLPKSFLSYLSKNISSYKTITSKIRTKQTSSNGTTTKLAIQLQDEHVVESVLMRHDNRITICISSQVGCAMGCTFCATGTMGIRGNLCSGEILEQLVHGSRVLLQDDTDESEKKQRSSKGNNNNNKVMMIRNVVFMGMGEPLNNYHNVLTTCRALINRRLWNLAYNHVTVSTVGVTSRMRDLTRDIPEVNLALSLHAPNQRMREDIVPSARGTPIESLIDALDEHMMVYVRKRRQWESNPQDVSADARRRGEADNVVDDDDEFNTKERQSQTKKKRAMIEYVMLTGDTSTIEAAHQLGQLCKGRHLVVNLIPYNKTNVKDKLSCPSEEHMQEFRRIVVSYGSFVTIRRTMGADISGACGQLVVEEEEKQSKEQQAVADIEDIGSYNVINAKEVRGNQQKRLAAVVDKKHPRNKVETDPMLWKLKVATAIAASCLVISSTLLLLQKRKR